MKTLFKIFLIFAAFFGENSDSFAQCFSSGCGGSNYQPISVVNYPKSFTTGLTFDIKIDVLACYPNSYSGRAKIIKIGNFLGPDRIIDTVNCVLTPGNTTFLSNILYPDSLLDEGVPNGDSTMFGFDVILLDNPNCSNENYLDLSPPIITVKILPMGLSESSESIESIYPTITSDKIFIGKTLKNYNGYLYNASGALIQKISGESLSLSANSKGLYFLVFINEKDKSIKKYKVIKI